MSRHSQKEIERCKRIASKMSIECPAQGSLAAPHCYAAPLDLTHPDANMYGCFPCPVCKSIYRWPTQQGTVRCDDCGLVQELEKTAQHNEKGQR
jgi:hypothetical protein